MKIFFLFLLILALVAGVYWLISRLSASKRLREEEAQEEARLDREAVEEVRAAEVRRHNRKVEAEESARQAARASVPKMPLRDSELEARRRRRARRDEDDGLAGDDLGVVYPTLADDLLTPYGSDDWRSLPDSYRELPDPPKHDPAPSTPSEDTGRWTPNFDSGHHAPVSAPDPAPYSPPSSTTSSTPDSSGGSGGGGSYD